MSNFHEKFNELEKKMRKDYEWMDMYEGILRCIDESSESPELKDIIASRATYAIMDKDMDILRFAIPVFKNDFVPYENDLWDEYYTPEEAEKIYRELGITDFVANMLEKFSKEDAE